MDCLTEKRIQRKHLRFYLNNKVVILLLLLFLYYDNCFAQEKEYSYSDIQGIWILNYNHKSEETPQIFENEYYVFHNDEFLVIATHNEWCTKCQDENIGRYKYGFSNSIYDVDTILGRGQYFTYKSKYDYKVLDNFIVRNKDYLELNYDECSYLERLPKKAQSVLYKRSLYDHRNYAREFLEYDICGIKVDNVQLLDSLQNVTETIINKDDIVIVRDTTGDLLQVEYEPEPNKYIKGYLKREDLQFVETKK